MSIVVSPVEKISAANSVMLLRSIGSMLTAALTSVTIARAASLSAGMETVMNVPVAMCKS